MVFRHRSIKVSKKRIRVIVKYSLIAIRGLKISSVCIYTLAYRYTCLKRTYARVRTDSWPLNISKGLVAV